MPSPMRTIGDYELLDELETEVGTVRYHAKHRMLPRRAVVHVAEAGAGASAVRLLREGCILEALRHPGVPRVFECGILPDHRPWLALESIEGDSLEGATLDVDDVIEVLDGVASILAYAHARGVLHRDITPAAIFRDFERGHMIVLDRWDNACTVDTELARPLRGTNHYRAPELAHDRPIDGRADVFALGVVAYEALTRQLPSLPLARRAPATPTALANLIDQMVNDDPLLRPMAANVVEGIAAVRAELAATTVIEIEVDDDEDSIEVSVEPHECEASVYVSSEVFTTRRTKPRWTPQWPLDEQAAAARGVVEIVPRRRRTHRD